MIRRRIFPLTLSLLALAATPGRAQIPEAFENLRVLRSDIPRPELVSIMRGYAGALGVRCIHCHVGDDPNDLSTVDFASDEREAKRVARAMMQMVETINADLLPRTGRSHSRTVQCLTCHGGITQPEPLGDLLAREIEENGIEAAIARYRELRTEYYGRAAYDFGPQSLNGLAERASRAENFETAIALSRLNVELNPEDAYSRFLQARIYSFAGQAEEAVGAFEHAVELDPGNGFFAAALEQARAALDQAGRVEPSHESE